MTMNWARLVKRLAVIIGRKFPVAGFAIRASFRAFPATGVSRTKPHFCAACASHAATLLVFIITLIGVEKKLRKGRHNDYDAKKSTG